MNPRGHAVTTFFWAALAAWWVLHVGDFESTGFDDRVVSNATVHGIDVPARSRMYLAALGAFVGGGVIVHLALARLSRALGEQARANLEHASFVGVMLVLFAGVTSLQTDAVVLCAALEVAYVVGVLLKAQPGAVFLLAAAGAYGLFAATPWRTEAAAVAGLTLVAVVVLARLERAGRERAFALLLGCAAAAAFVPLALVVREEIVLVANQRGILWVQHGVASVVCIFVLGITAWLVARRRPFDASRTLARVVFPALIVGFGTIAIWTAERDPPNEMLEAGNAGLALQQWFDHGRLPFFDTFDVHGLSDCLMGFVYSWCNGWSRSAWQHWDFVPFVVAQLAVYALLARTLGHAPLAFVLAIASPFVRAIFPPEIVMGAVFALVAAWSARKQQRAAFAWTAAAWIALALWRIDLGFAAALALALTWIAAVVIERSPGFAWKRALTGAGAVGMAALLVAFLVASARGVDLSERFDELRRIAASDTAFGRARIFESFDAAVVFRLFVAPALTVASIVWLIVRARGDAEGKRRFATYALVFLACFSLVIFTRGLVRHTFVEHDATYVTGFQFAVIALTPVVTAPAERRRARIAVALALHALLPLAFDISTERAQEMVWRANSFVRASIRMRRWHETWGTTRPHDRAPVPDEYRASNIEPLAALSKAVLEPGETFCDLSASPMLYVLTGARSPHWANHLIVLQGDVLQKRFLAELEHERAPLVVMRQDYDLARAAGMTPDVMIDEIPIALWHARIFDELMSKSEPLVMAGRWLVWARSDWAPAREWGPPGEHVNNVLPGNHGAEFDLAAGETLALAVPGTSTADATLSVQFLVDDGVIHDNRARHIAWPAGAQFRFVDVVTATRPAHVALQYLGGLGKENSLVLGSVSARRIADPARADAARRAETVVDTELGRTAAAWGRFDRVPRVTTIPLLSATDPKRDVPKGSFARFDFAPRPREGRSLLCELILSVEGAPRDTIVVRYGIGDVVGGTYRFDVDSEVGPTTYVFRPGMQANWHLRNNTWLEVGSPDHAIIVHSARLCAND